ncbi:PREDICTED: zinc finger protein 595-like [Papilio polytes]|uniref:zinc finger protein 595-like n=1 Tax=Papilio polytes TaxID=76194 RepID=UPI000676A7E7|nr:PREDICTED: zinc finger protein 595-like [Papilio polytes]
MEITDCVLCVGCLCVGRKMLILEDYWKKKCFLQILSEIPVLQNESIPMSLCWECDAIISRFTKFQRQVIDSFEVFQNYLKQNTDLSQIRTTSRLETHKIIDIIIPDDLVDIKVEKVWDVGIDQIKTEDCSENTDDRELEIKRKKSRKLNKKCNKVYKEIELSAEELDVERRVLLCKEEYINAVFKCDNCITVFPNADDLQDHIYLKHEVNASKFKCDVCKCSFSTEVSYNYHINRHKRRFKCQLCEKNFISKTAVTKHYNIVHSVDYNCQMESKLNDDQEVIVEEIQNNSTEQPCFPCELCEKTFRWKTSLRKHLETHRIETGQKRKPYCETCRLSFTTTSNLQKHIKTSSKHQILLKVRNLKDLPLEENPEKKKDRIEEIKASVNKQRETFPCPQCDKKFQWRGNLARHMESHTARAKGDLICEPCNRTFSSKATYEQHMKVSMRHVSENDFKYMCSECGKRFANKTRLRDHVDWDHLKNYVHKCTECQKVFKSHTSLYLHKQNVHEKDQAGHLCHHCGKAFPNQAKLRGHVSGLHAREAPYKCVSCSARFSWHSCLSRHVRRVHRKRDT